MSEFIEERIKLVRSLAEKADPFTKIRLLKLADRYEGQVRPTPSRATREINMPIDLSTFRSTEHAVE